MNVNKSALLAPGLFLLFLLPMQGQTVDVVTLQTGTEIRGQLLKVEPRGVLKIRDKCENTWVFNMDEVARIIKDTLIHSKHTASLRTPGWTSTTTFGFLAGSVNNEQVAPFSLLASAGYQNRHGIYTGLSTGMEFLKVNHMPVVADIHYDLLGTEVVLQLLARGGYYLPLHRKESLDYGTYQYSGGWGGSCGIGLKFKGGHSYAWYLNLLYRYMRNSYSERYDHHLSAYEYTDIYRRMEIRMGIMIH